MITPGWGQQPLTANQLRKEKHMPEDTAAIRIQLLQEIAAAENADALKFATEKLNKFDEAV